MRLLFLCFFIFIFNLMYLSGSPMVMLDIYNLQSAFSIQEYILPCMTTV